MGTWWDSYLELRGDWIKGKKLETILEDFFDYLDAHEKIKRCKCQDEEVE